MGWDCWEGPEGEGRGEGRGRTRKSGEKTGLEGTRRGGSPGQAAASTCPVEAWPGVSDTGVLMLLSLGAGRRCQ